MRVIKRTLLIPPGRELGNRATEPGFKKIFLIRQILQYLDILLLVNSEKLENLKLGRKEMKPKGPLPRPRSLRG